MTAARRGPLWFLERWALHAEVVAVEDVTPRMRHVVLAGADLAGRAWTPGQQVRVMFKDLTHPGSWLAVRDLPDAARTYSLWDYDGGAGRYALRVLDHDEDGPGARWARTVRVGDAAIVSWPEGSFHARLPSPYHLFAGEETATVCFRALPAGEVVLGAVEADTAAGHVADLPRGDALVRVDREGASASPSAPLLDAIRALDLPETPGTAYLAGEAKTIQAIRRHLIDDRGWTRGDILTKPFWAPGKRGMD